jgi:hypothetical protein
LQETVFARLKKFIKQLRSVTKKEATYVKQPQALYVLLFWGNRELLFGNSYSNSSVLGFSLFVLFDAN